MITATPRSPVYGHNVVATSQPLAAQAGLMMLQAGGTAADAALACAMALTVVEPTGCGIGGDAFAQIYDGEHLVGLDAAGRSPMAWRLDRFEGLDQMPDGGWDTVTVPGAVHGWYALWHRYGRLTPEQIAAPAVRLAREGFPVSPKVARLWSQAARRHGHRPAFADTFLPGGRAPRAGELFRLPALGDTLARLAATEGADLYTGALAERLITVAQAGGGALSAADLKQHRSAWVVPVPVRYRGHTLHELPPAGQGLAALMALGILERFEPPADRQHPAWVHLQIEAMKIAFAEAHTHVADPGEMSLGVEDFLEPEWLDDRAAAIDPDRAGAWPSTLPLAEGTVYVACADADGLMVSFIQSNFHGFGSGEVVPHTGIALQDRGRGFVLTPGHPNQVRGGQRPYHTLIPGFLTRNGEPLAALGVMGGHMQPQGHVQVVGDLVDFGVDPQQALDAPRWHVTRDGRVALETGMAPRVAAGLAERGHTLIGSERYAEAGVTFGGGQVVQRVAEGVYCAGSDPRKDGVAIAW